MQALAEAQLEPRWAGYVAGGAGAERTLAANVDAFAGHRLRQRVLAGLATIDLRTDVLGLQLDFPVFCAPVAYQGALHADGELATARAAAAVGAGMCLSTFSSFAPEDVNAGAPRGARLYQVYVFRDHGVTDELVEQALAAGFSGLLLTVDLPLPGTRDRELRHSWTFVDDEIPAITFAKRRGAYRSGVDVIDPALDWSYLERLCARFDVPIVVKGILDPDDARRSIEHGAAGVVVSNHGGRQLDPTTATLEALPRVVEAIGDRATVLFDSGIRRGSDIAIALALGARAVLCGRLPVWGLAAGGEAGVRRVLELLRDELTVTLHLMGCASITDLDDDVLC